jgi:hypothetical protein
MNEFLLAAGEHLRVRFTRLGDRWTHAIEASDANGLLWRLESLEGAADEFWPPSPPLQSLQWHAPAQGEPVALLVGMAGSSHWSATIAADGNHLLFDIACRLSAQPISLGSSYRLSDSAGQPLPLSASQPKIHLLPLATADASPGSVISDSGRITVCIEDPRSNLPRTVRWHYAVSIS